MVQSGQQSISENSGINGGLENSLGPIFSPLSLPENQIPSVQAEIVTGRQFHVAAGGSDQNDGSEASPWKTIQYAVSQLQAGDTVYISEGTYQESVQISSSGSTDAWITLEGVGNVVIDGANLGPGKSGFDTNGNDYLRFKNFTLNHLQAGIQMDSGSSHIEIDGLNADGNIYAVRMDTASNVTVRNAYAINCNNAFRAFGASHDLLFENIETYNSQDVYAGMNPDYLNGDGFILESNVSNVTIRNAVSANNWDAGFDIKASNVLIENAVAYGNKNNFKTWGDNIVIKSSLSHHAKSQVRSDGTTVEGNGITVQSGTTSVINMTFADNEDHEIRIYSGALLSVEDSIVVRRNISGMLFESDGAFTGRNILWFNLALESPLFSLAPTDLWANPGFVDWQNGNYHLSESSLALDFGDSANLSAYDLDGLPRVAGSANDLGAYEIQTDVPAKFKGLANGDTVSGTIYVEPDPAFWPQIRNVTYFIDGRKITSTSKRPYSFGGTQGYNTLNLSPGTHTMEIIVQVTKTLKVTYLIAFKVYPPGVSSFSYEQPSKKKKKLRQA
ncbi:MAG TPA: right-handed parallel beta-helix repeat-containing protein [bacterium]|nr:right-handed parallel beta-helix repeat-containing protein [bacterium]